MLTKRSDAKTLSVYAKFNYKAKKIQQKKCLCNERKMEHGNEKIELAFYIRVNVSV